MTREASGKRLELLREIIPKLSRVIVLSNPENPVVVLSLQETRAAAQTFSLKLDSVDMRKPSELDRALSVIVGTRPVLPDRVGTVAMAGAMAAGPPPATGRAP